MSGVLITFVMDNLSKKTGYVFFVDLKKQTNKQTKTQVILSALRPLVYYSTRPQHTLLYLRKEFRRVSCQYVQ